MRKYGLSTDMEARLTSFIKENENVTTQHPYGHE